MDEQAIQKLFLDAGVPDLYQDLVNQRYLIDTQISDQLGALYEKLNADSDKVSNEATRQYDALERRAATLDPEEYDRLSSEIYAKEMAGRKELANAYETTKQTLLDQRQLNQTYTRTPEFLQQVITNPNLVSSGAAYTKQLEREFAERAAAMEANMPQSFKDDMALLAERNKIFDQAANLPPIPVQQAPELTPEYYLSKSEVPRAAAEAEADRILQNYNISDPNARKEIADIAQLYGVPYAEQQLAGQLRSQGIDLGSSRQQVPLNQARQIAQQVISSSGYGFNEDAANNLANYISRFGVDAGLEEFEKLNPYSKVAEKRLSYDSAKELANLLFDTSGIQKSGFYDDGRNASDVFSSWVASSQNRPIEETIAAWNKSNPSYAVNFGQQENVFTGFGSGRNITDSVQAILTKEAERQGTIRQQNLEDLRNQIDFITSGGLEQQPFQPSVPPLAPSTGGVLTTGTGQPIQPGFTPSPTPTQPFYPTQPGFQPEFQAQPGFQPQFQSPAATPLITQAQRPVLDQTVQFIESGGMSPTTGAQPMQPISYGELGAFTPQSQPYFTAPPLGYTTPAAEYAATGVVPMQEGGSVGLKAAAQQLASMGRNGDTMLAHITPQEAGLLKALGGSGTVNPNTGLPEFAITGFEMALIGMMGLGTAATIQEQRKQRKAFESEQNRQRQERLQQLARGQAAYERSGLKDIPLESSPMRGGKVDPTTKFDPSMGGVRVGEGLPEIPIPRQGAQALQPPPAAPATPMMDEEERRRRGMAQGGMPTFEYGGTTAPTGEPRMVKGAGDGMSDNVPATIEGVQEARLANDEFVIPADVVADIGNGSSSAGARKLYEMMDRIREARHGTTEQPPEISAEKYLPS